MKPKEPNPISMKYNLFQNFYIIGYSLSDFFSLKTKKSYTFSDIFSDPLNIKFTPKLISKFPSSIKNYNSIQDDLVISHCFPNGIKILNDQVLSNNITHFEFNLDNIPSNYSEEDKSLYSKIYFNCLEFYEPLSSFFDLKKEILARSAKIKLQIEEEKENKNSINLSSIFLPKIICFASLLPFSNEIKDVLYNIYSFYKSNLIGNNNNNLIPLEKIVEQIVMKTPLPVSSEVQVSITFKLSNVKNITSEKIKFPEYNIKESFIKNYNSISFGEFFNYFSAEDIMKIFKYILLEIPLLFFCKNKSALSLFVDNLLSLLNPFVYILPHISLLPQELYGLINSESKFIFGINEEYSKDFFEDKIFEMIQKIEEVECLVLNEKNKKKENDKNTEENIFYNNNYINILTIELPSSAKKKAISSLNELLSNIKKKNDLSDAKFLAEHKFNYNVQHIFFKFFIYIMAGYTDYLLNSKFFNNNSRSKIKNIGENIRFKSVDEDFIKEVFNLNEFILSHSKDELFYIAFSKTKLFFNFFREKIYANNVLDKVRHEQFDEFIFLKKHKDFRKKKENKGLYENLRKHTMDKEPFNQNVDIVINNELFFTKNEINEITKENNIFKILTTYGQDIIPKIKKNKNVENPNINYYIFPKLIFDDSFFEEKYEILFQSHNINIPGMGNLDALKKKSIVFSDTNTKYRKYMHVEQIVGKLPLSNFSQENFEVKYINYIYYSWFLLQSCSLWYCEPIERNIRIDKILEVLNKLDYVEEQVLFFLFINLYKYGNKYQFIKLHKINLKFYGYSNYYFLYLLYNKIKEKKEDINLLDEENVIEEEEKEDEYVLRRRYLIDTNDEIIQNLLMKNLGANYKRRGKDINDSNNINKEEIIFSNEQFCKKCGNIKNISFEDIVKNQLNTYLEYFTYNCEKCNGIENEIIFKYHILLSNLHKKEAIVCGKGEQKLSTPYKLYISLKNYFQKRKNYELNIPNIFKEKEINLPLIILYFAIINLPYDFLLPYKTNEEKENNLKNKENKEQSEFIPVKINYDTDDVYRRFNNLYIALANRKRSSRRINNNNSIEPFTIKGINQNKNEIVIKK